MIWPFRRAPKPRLVMLPVHTAEVWRPGDVAECVSEEEYWLDAAGQPFAGPETGSRSIVTGVILSPLNEAAMLRLVGWPGRGFCAAAFRKIVLTDVEVERKVGKRKPTAVDA